MNNCLYCKKSCQRKYCSIICYRKHFSENPLINPNYGKKHPNLHSIDFKNKQSQRMKDRKVWNFVKNFRNKNISKEVRQKFREHAIRLNEKGFENRGGKTKFFKVDNIILQGQYELYYYLICKIKPTKPKQIKTPYGFYAPDFDFGDHFIEIKSTYTLRTCCNGKQIKKINWVKKHIKQVKILVLNGDLVVEYLSKIDLTKYIYKVGKQRSRFIAKTKA